MVSLPAHAGEEKYTAQARAVLALSRYSLGVPVADAPQWDQAERVADCAYPVFEQLRYLAAQGEVIYMTV